MVGSPSRPRGLAERFRSTNEYVLVEGTWTKSGASAVHRAILFGVCMMTLFFLLRDGEAVSTQCLIASQRLFGSRGGRVALQMMASVHGTLNGLVLVAIGEGLLLGVVYFFTKVPHPNFLWGLHRGRGDDTPLRLRSPLFAALVLLVSGGVVGAIVVLVAGFIVTFTADHFVRPTLIGGATRLSKRGIRSSPLT